MVALKLRQNKICFLLWLVLFFCFVAVDCWMPRSTLVLKNNGIDKFFVSTFNKMFKWLASLYFAETVHSNVLQKCLISLDICPSSFGFSLITLFDWNGKKPLESVSVGNWKCKSRENEKKLKIEKVPVFHHHHYLNKTE